jgi:low affinity Fe/Cu permease
MKHQRKIKKSVLHERFAHIVTQATGSTNALVIAFLLIIVWAIVGFIFGFSEKWLLIINTATSIVTFLMVFLIQKAHNKDSLAIQLKLNELVAAHQSANNKLVNVEHKTEEELKDIQQNYFRLADDTKNENVTINTNKKINRETKTKRGAK